MTHTVDTHTFSAHRSRLGTALAALALACTFASALPARAAITGSGDIEPNVEDPDFPGVFVLNYDEVTGASAEPDVIIGGTGDSINDTDIGTLFIDAPAFTPIFTSDSGIIGDEQQGAGFVTIAQAGSRWGIDDELIVGNEGQGTLDLVNGGALTGDPADDPADAALEVIIGAESIGQGLVTVRNAGSLLRSDTLVVGDLGSGVLELTLGGQVETNTMATIGDTDGSGDFGTGLVNVDGSGTRWLIGRIMPTTGQGTEGSLIVGDFGRGNLNITNRGVVRVTNDDSSGGNVVIGRQVNSLGEVVVDGVFSQLRAFGTITVGGAANNARGVLRVRNGGEVRSTGAMTIGVDGVLEVAGGSVLAGGTGITNGGTIQTAVGATGQIDSILVNTASGEILNAGTADRVREKLTFTRAVTNNAGGLISSIGGEMIFTSTVINNGLIAGRDAIYRFRDPFTNNAGGSFAFSVGDSDVFGNVTNNGNLGVATDTSVTFYDPVVNNANLTVLPGGAAIFLNGLTLAATSVVDLQLNATANVEEIGELQVFGTASLAGTLDLTTFAGLDPQPGDSFQIISATNILGTFSTVTFPPAPGNNWMIDYNPNSVIINYLAAPAFSGDFNMDNVVDAADLDIWKMNVGMMVPPGTLGDANGDGIVDGSDFLIWQRTLGPVPVVAAVGAVPEPGSLALAASALALVSACRRKRSAAGPVTA
jgi:T5SS/PEP-CTERM-associated repeat protein